MQYVDANALVKVYVGEPDAARAQEILNADPDWMTAGHTIVEVRRNLARILRGDALTSERNRFTRHWAAMSVVELTPSVCERAASISETTGLRTMDALHLGAAQVAASGMIPFVTFDVRLAHAARSLGWTVLGS